MKTGYSEISMKIREITRGRAERMLSNESGTSGRQMSVLFSTSVLAPPRILIYQAALLEDRWQEASRVLYEM